VRKISQLFPDYETDYMHFLHFKLPHSFFKLFFSIRVLSVWHSFEARGIPHCMRILIAAKQYRFAVEECFWQITGRISTRESFVWTFYPLESNTKLKQMETASGRYICIVQQDRTYF